jgi:lipopolysaccharide transport system ATP-binding protein
MSDIAIRVENLGKRYRIGAAEKQATTLGQAVRRATTAPFNYLISTLRGPTDKEIIWALKDVSFEVKYGEVVGIIGRNGAGKSTLLKILSRITEPTKGRARVYGRVGSLLEVGTGFHKELTGRENIYMNGAILGMTRAEIKRKFDEIVDFAGVEQFIDTPVKRYSSGMRIRLAFAVAAHLEPEILLIDEVLAVGDAEFQKKCLGKMDEVAKGGRTVLFVSHNMGQMTKLCQRTMLLEDGYLKLDDTSQVVVDQYLLSTLSSITNQETRKPQIKNEKVDLLSLQITGINDQETPATGEDCRIRTLLDFKETIINPGIIFSINSTDGAKLFHVNTQPISNFNTGKCAGKTQFTLTIKNMPLTAGQYILMFGIKTIPYNPVIPLTEVCKFEVRAKDYYSSGTYLTNSRGLVVARHQWSIDRDVEGL